MPRKRSGTTDPQEDAALPQAAENNGEQAPGETPEEGKPANKKEAVRRAMAVGIESPTRISEYVKEKFDIHMTPDHVSTVKGNIKKEKAGGRKARGRGRPRRQETAGASVQAPRASSSSAAAEGGLTAEELSTLAALAERAGGVERLQEFLAALRRLR